MKKVFSDKIRALVLALGLIFMTAPMQAAAPEAVDETTLTLQENLAYPAVSSKKASKVVAAMEELVRKMRSQRLSVDTERNGEVVCVTVPASAIFRANGRVISPEGRKLLASLERYVGKHEYFKVLVAVHTDNTGDEKYADEITDDRANAIEDYFVHECGRDIKLIPYGLGFDEPVASNATVKGRAANRRVEFFFVPTITYIKHLTE